MRGPRSLIRRYWMSGVLVFGMAGLMIYGGKYLYRTELRLQEVRLTRLELEAQLEEERRRNQLLQAQLEKMTSDEFMEVMAKEMGFVYPGETVYRTGPRRND